ncbi:hypothetical protein ACFL3T_02770 [Patescibacteria group bacterium]
MKKIREASFSPIISTEVPKPARFKLPRVWNSAKSMRESYFRAEGERKSERETQVVIDADLVFENPNLTGGEAIYVDGNPIKAIREALFYGNGWFRNLLYNDVFNQVCNGSFSDPNTLRHFSAGLSVDTKSATFVFISNEVIRIKLKVKSIMDFMSNHKMTPEQAYEASQQIVIDEIVNSTAKNLTQMSKNGHASSLNGSPLKAKMALNRKAQFRITPEPTDIDKVVLHATNVVLTPYDNE